MGNVAGIDVHKKMLAVVIRVESEDKVEYLKRKFGTTANEVVHLASWLTQQNVLEAALESTAEYWRPVWNGLEAHLKLHLCNPLQVKARRGRKQDFRDAQRLADRWHSGDLEESFVPGAEQRSWRWLTRSRVQLRRLIGAARSRVECLLEQGGIQLTSVVTDPFGVSGWAMLKLLAKGERDVKILVGEARGQLKKKEAELTQALVGKLNPTHRLVLQQSLEQVELLRRQIEEINQALKEAMLPHTAALVRLVKIPGVDLAAAQELLAEIGPGAVTFPSGGQFASWVGVCSGSNESAGVTYSRRSAKGNRYLRRLLCQIAWAAIRTKDTFYGSLFRRLSPRLGAKGAAWAVAHRIGKVIWLLLHEEVEYRELGPAPQRPKSLVKKLQRLQADFARAGMDLQSVLGQCSPAVA